MLLNLMPGIWEYYMEISSVDKVIIVLEKRSGD